MLSNVKLLQFYPTVDLFLLCLQLHLINRNIIEIIEKISYSINLNLSPTSRLTLILTVALVLTLTMTLLSSLRIYNVFVEGLFSSSAQFYFISFGTSLLILVLNQLF